MGGGGGGFDLKVTGRWKGNFLGFGILRFWGGGGGAGILTRIFLRQWESGHMKLTRLFGGTEKGTFFCGGV